MKKTQLVNFILNLTKNLTWIRNKLTKLGLENLYYKRMNNLLERKMDMLFYNRGGMRNFKHLGKEIIKPNGTKKKKSNK